MRFFLLLAAALIASAVAPTSGLAVSGVEKPKDVVHAPTPPAPRTQLPEQAAAKSRGCLTCHTATDSSNMHSSPAAIIGCTDCHGGNSTVFDPKLPEAERKKLAHVQPTLPNTWDHPSSANPIQSYTLLNRESPEYIRFVNPGDLRIAREACGGCHLPIIQAVERSLMSTGAMLWGGAAYNNGILPFKRYVTGEAYTREGVSATVVNPVKPDEKLTKKGVLPSLIPLPAWEVIPPADTFRIFERGGRNNVNLFPEIAIPNSLGQLQRLEEPGRPDIRQSNRGPGTGNRIAVPVLNITKTRLNDPYLWFLGTNDQPGDYRSSGCTSCHVVYANDRDPRHSGPYAKYGHTGKTQTKDPTIPKDEEGHPLRHTFTNAIPSSQCMICHMHQPNVFVNTYLGYTMWDYESDAAAMWPEKQKYPTDAEAFAILQRNPEEAAIRGKWGDLEFLKQVSEMNPKLENTQFADYHGHGWNFRGVFKKDRKGNMLDAKGTIIEPEDPKKWKKAVHLSSIHLDAGMHCVDCHFSQDSHGNGHIYGEVQAAIEIRCKDCHGTADKHPTLKTSGPAAPAPSGNSLDILRVSDGRARFVWRGTQCDLPEGVTRDCQLYQRAALDPKKEWKVSLVKDSVTPNHAEYNPKAARAKLMAKDKKNLQWGPGVAVQDRAHKDEELECFTCHLSWTTSCAGCHLPIQSNWKTERKHFEGGESRNFASYNPQVARDQMFQLGRHSSVKGNTIAPVRSTSALVLSSQNINRERIYISQPPVAASGFSSQAFAPHFAHTVRKTETKTCTDCHLSKENDNNAIMAQLLLYGTNFVNFVGPFSYVGTGDGVEGIQVAEFDEPQAVIGSFLHRHAYPDWFKQHQERGQKIPNGYGHSGGQSQCLQVRGEYLYSAEGPTGLRIYDVASIANKGISQRIITAPFSPLGQHPGLASSHATCVALPTNQPIAPLKNQGDLMRKVNEEQAFHPIYNYAFVTDSIEGLIVTDVNTFQDGEPRNNFIERAVTWNPNGLLTGARHITIAGSIFYITTPREIVVLDMDDPLKPKLAARIPIKNANSTALQFRYLFVAEKSGLSVVDVTEPRQPRVVPGAHVPLQQANRVYVARTFAYVAAGPQGLAIIDVEKPEQPRLYQTFNAGGKLNDARDVIVATTNASLIAYVADGRNGLKVIQLTAPDTQPRFYGFSPDPKPQLISQRETDAPALALSKGLDRDRAVDETGNQIAVFGRLGSRPFNLEEMKSFYLDGGAPWFVTDEVRTQDFVPAGRAAAKPPVTRQDEAALKGNPVR